MSKSPRRGDQTPLQSEERSTWLRKTNAWPTSATTINRLTASDVIAAPIRIRRTIASLRRRRGFPASEVATMCYSVEVVAMGASS